MIDNPPTARGGSADGTETEDLESVEARADAAKQRALALAPILADRAEDTEARRQLPPETIADLQSSGLSRLCQPSRYGGAELPMDRAVGVIASLAQG